jgi:hypothetical protein
MQISTGKDFRMIEKPPKRQASQDQASLSRWENEGGLDARQKDELQDIPELTNTELVHLRVRVIALENIVISLLTQAPDEQHKLIREMADFISPRVGSTQHPLTIDAASHMRKFVDRAIQFSELPDAQS